MTMSPADRTAFPTLDAAQIAALESLGKRRLVQLGDLLYRAGVGEGSAAVRSVHKYLAFSSH